VIGKLMVTVLAGEVRVAALHLNGYHIDWRIVMRAAGLRVDENSADLGYHSITSFDVLGDYGGGDA
jgi:hypothetical protein